MSIAHFTYADDNRQSGRLVPNLLHFGRVLRAAGMKLGPASILDVLEAVRLDSMRTREDFYWTLHAVLVKRREDHVIFDQAFHVFWRKPKMLDELLQLLRIEVLMPTSERQRKQAATTRLAETYFASLNDKLKQEEDKQVEIEAVQGASADDVLRHKDFEQMTVAEQALAREALKKINLSMRKRPTHRFERNSQKRQIDLLETLRLMRRNGGEMIGISFKAPKQVLPPLVVLCDISGSCTEYSRMFLQFLHGLVASRNRVQVFTFGSRLTNITRDLARRDVDEAIARVSLHVKDWSGGTRIGASIKEFNFRWSRRVLGQRAEVLLMTDGLERDDIELLSTEMQRLKRSVHKLTWLNPLLRYDRFVAQSEGIRAIMPNVDAFRPVHNLESIYDLAGSFGNKHQTPQDMKQWMGEPA